MKLNCYKKISKEKKEVLYLKNVVYSTQITITTITIGANHFRTKYWFVVSDKLLGLAYKPISFKLYFFIIIIIFYIISILMFVLCSSFALMTAIFLFILL